MNRKLLMMLSLVGQLGFIIALPAAGLGFGGAYLDRQLGTSPLFILLGLGVAITISSLAVWTMVKRIEREE